ncbi:MAG: Cof-type HAD-IIB family hydrolase [Lachnospiraceae bacterium]|nr:Cof-type HAD-IIB family hydrolase [Lachnospiraceae bacterium]
MKAIFFDIDGTLIDFDGSIPDSTLDALHRAQKNGHAVFLCSGRCKSMIDPRLMAIGFDGIIASSGAYVEYHNQVISAEFMTEAHIRKLLPYMEAHHMLYMFQCTDKVVATTAANRLFALNLQGKNASEEDVERLMGKRVSEDQLLENFAKYPNIEKGNYQMADVPVDVVRRDLAPMFDVTAMSFLNAPDTAGEITMAGINKAFGIQKVMDYLHLDREDTIAFGDGPNDYEMIAFAGTGVAMGNAIDELKNLADMITDTVSENGVCNGMMRLQLI